MRRFESCRGHHRFKLRKYAVVRVKYASGPSRKLAISVAVVVVLGTAGFFVGRYFVGSNGGEAKQPSVAIQLEQIQTQQAGKDTEAVSVVRVTTRYDTQSVAKSHVSTQTIGGREAVVVSPASSSGLGQRYLIYFPESFGKTSTRPSTLIKTRRSRLPISRAIAW